MIRDFISLIFPEVCASCRSPTVKGEQLLCTKCLLDLPKTNDHLFSPGVLVDKFATIEKLRFVYAYLKFSKKGVAQRLLHQLKYEGQQEIGLNLGRWFGSEIQSNENKLYADIILPVPLHISRFRTRGYNQSDLFAKGLSEPLQIEWSNDIIKRLKKTETQTKKGKVDRWKNVSDIFRIIDPNAIHDKRIILVDDVITTGATLNACLEVLVGSNVRSVGVLTIARAD